MGRHSHIFEIFPQLVWDKILFNLQQAGNIHLNQCRLVCHSLKENVDNIFGKTEQGRIWKYGQLKCLNQYKIKLQGNILGIINDMKSISRFPLPNKYLSISVIHNSASFENIIKDRYHVEEVMFKVNREQIEILNLTLELKYDKHFSNVDSTRLLYLYLRMYLNFVENVKVLILELRPTHRWTWERISIKWLEPLPQLRNLEQVKIKSDFEHWIYEVILDMCCEREKLKQLSIWTPLKGNFLNLTVLETRLDKNSREILLASEFQLEELCLFGTAYTLQDTFEILRKFKQTLSVLVLKGNFVIAQSQNFKADLPKLKKLEICCLDGNLDFLQNLTSLEEFVLLYYYERIVTGLVVKATTSRGKIGTVVTNMFGIFPKLKIAKFGLKISY